MKCPPNCGFHCGREAAVLNDEPGKIFRERPVMGFDKRCPTVDGSVCVLIVDPVLGSRFSLAQAVARPGYLIKTASTVEEALDHLASALDHPEDAARSVVVACDNFEPLVGSAESTVARLSEKISAAHHRPGGPGRH